MKQETLASIEQGKSEPEEIAGTAYQRHLNPYPKGDVRYVPTSDDELAEVKATSLEDVKKFYSDFYGASSGELAIVGDIDAKAAAGSPRISSTTGRARAPMPAFPASTMTLPRPMNRSRRQTRPMPSSLPG